MAVMFCALPVGVGIGIDRIHRVYCFDSIEDLY